MEKVNNFIKNIEEIKEKSQLDLSKGEDLSLALMNLISLEEHFAFSYMKTSQESYLEWLEQIRELRKKLLKKIAKENEAEDWCSSKHLLASSMRLIEIGTKYLHDGKKREAEELFIEAFNLYSLFWAINGAVDMSKIKEKISSGKFSKISQLIKKIVDCCKE